jgi:hypothetical protein
VFEAFGISDVAVEKVFAPNIVALGEDSHGWRVIETCLPGDAPFNNVHEIRTLKSCFLIRIDRLAGVAVLKNMLAADRVSRCLRASRHRGRKQRQHPTHGLLAAAAGNDQQVFLVANGRCPYG